MIWDPNERLLWGMVILLFFICACIFFYKGKKMEKRNEKILLYGLGVFNVFYGIMWIFWKLAELHVSGYYQNHIYYGDFGEYSLNFELLAVIGGIFGFIGVAIFIFSFEFVIKRTKYIFTLINIIIMTILLIFISNTENFYLAYIPAMVILVYDMILFFLILIYLTKRSRPEFRTVSSFFLFGMILQTNGYILSYDIIKELNVIPLIIPPILYIIGILVVISPALIDPKYFSRTSTYWLVFCLLIIAFNWILQIYFIFIRVPIYILIANLIINIGLILTFYWTIKNIKSEPVITGTTSDSERGLDNLLGGFVRIKKVTEEEVSISKEKKICLVCKGKVLGNAYICTGCETFYCMKCSEAISNLENACWACDEPIDKKKPSKPFRNEEKRHIGKASALKKGKKS